ncbi:MAG: radical SAM protein, partial [Eubacteriales bacterium]|nr:radical SAM protein [Eubacteriales bacterium]
IQKNAPVLAKITLTTVDDALAKKIEPHAPAPSRRLAAIRALSQAGIPVCVLLMPVLPFIEDDPAMIQALVQAAAAHGAGYIYGLFGVTLRANQRQYFFDRLEERFPGMKEKYVKQFGLEYACHSPRTAELTQTLETACEETGMVYRMQDIIQGYQGPYKTEQISLLGT